jgi:hypothetical protein
MDIRGLAAGHVDAKDFSHVAAGKAGLALDGKEVFEV